jgi:hypothetical protein
MKILHEFKQKVGDKEYNIKLKQMSRRDREDLAIFYSAEYGKALAKGLAPHLILRKNVIDSGGLFSQKDIERMEEISRAISSKSNEFQRLELEKQDSAEIRKEIEDLWAEYQEYEKVTAMLYSRSAEYEAEKNTVTYATLNFTYVDDSGERELFPGSTNDSRLNFYYECDEANKELEIEAFNKAFSCYHMVIKSSEPVGKDEFEAITGGAGEAVS